MNNNLAFRNDFQSLKIEKKYWVEVYDDSNNYPMMYFRGQWVTKDESLLEIAVKKLALIKWVKKFNEISFSNPVKDIVFDVDVDSNDNVTINLESKSTYGIGEYSLNETVKFAKEQLQIFIETAEELFSQIDFDDKFEKTKLYVKQIPAVEMTAEV
ncbi:hypothetical protein DESAMIL20_645 [Desulfurella amilsii]|uniref:Uncharacterized protein n=1 Tax=Desulfurella amilsii TaxID=1562698 RepID=A0A1X4XYB7_9BACT|nr:hypothetical protein [Desulfurella amilsii]OSS42530.1 hypothetical protein DESAMIL20_645 [Desulfurella amilsii]